MFTELARRLAVWRLRFRALTRRRRMDQDLDRELRAHLDLEASENLRRGLSPGDARRRAVMMFGGVERTREEARDARGVSVMENIIRDLRFTLRGLQREPMLLLAATLSIGIGAGGNLAVLTLARAVLLSPPDARRPAELVQMRVSHASHVTYRHWRDLRESGALADVAGYSIERSVNWFRDESAAAITPMLVTANFFDLTGVPFARGRGFSEAEAEAESDPRLAVVTHEFWERELGGDTGVPGGTMVVNGEPYTIVGVLRPRIRTVAGHGVAPSIYLPLNLAIAPEIRGTGRVVQLIGRLKPGQTLAQARAAVDAADRRLGRLDGDTLYAGVDEFARLGAIASAKEGRTLGAFLALLGLVSVFVLVVACANVAGLLIARGTARRREIATRLAIGGTRGRLLQQLLVEGFWLALLGTVFGLLLTAGLVRVANRLTLPLPIPIALNLSIDLPALVSAGGLVLLTTVLCALLPAIGATRLSLTPALHREVQARTGGRLTSRSILLAGQVAVSTVLLITAFLFVRNLARTQTTNPGFGVDRLLVVELGFAASRPDADRLALLDRAVEVAGVVPGVDGAAVASAVPLTMHSGSRNGRTAWFDGHSDGMHIEYVQSLVGPRYFRTMDIAVQAGREFLPGDRAGAPPVGIVNAEFVRRYLQVVGTVGTHVQMQGEAGRLDFDIVGVVDNSLHSTLGESQRAAVYFPLAQHPEGLDPAFVLVRTRSDPAMLVRSLRESTGALDRTVAVTVQPMRRALAFAILPSRIGATLLGVLGGFGLVLASFGLYAIVAYNVSRRRAEIAIRMALGSTSDRIIRLIVRDAARLVALGVGIGLGVAFFITRPLATFLVEGLSASDPWSFVGTAVVFLLVSVVASWIPARQATRVCPVSAMRVD